jgi:hypothetical protein
MSDRRDATGHRDWPWDRPHSHEEDVLEADLRIDRWTLDAIRGIGGTLAEVLGAINALDVNQQAHAESVARIETTQRTTNRHLAAIDTKEKKIMAKLDAITAAIAADRAVTAAEHEEVVQALTEAAAKADALQAKLDEMSANTVTDEEIAAAAADATSLGDAIKDIYTAPVVEPPVEPVV